MAGVQMLPLVIVVLLLLGWKTLAYLMGVLLLLVLFEYFQWWLMVQTEI